MKKIYFFIFLLFLHLCSRNSLAGLVNFSDLKKKINLFIFLFFLHLCNRNSLAGLVILFRFEKKIIFLFLFLHSCNRNSLAGLVHFIQLWKIHLLRIKRAFVKGKETLGWRVGLKLLLVCACSNLGTDSHNPLLI